MFIGDLTHDLVLARSTRFVRFGAAIPMLGLCTIALTSRLLDPSWRTFAFAMVGLSVVGQVLTWWGVHGVWRRNGWDTGVLFYLWIGGILGAMAITATGVLVLAPIPLVAPLVATFARWRMRRAARSAGVAR